MVLVKFNDVVLEGGLTLGKRCVYRRGVKALPLSNFSVFAPASAIASPWSHSPAEDSVSFLSISRVLSSP